MHTYGTERVQQFNEIAFLVNLNLRFGAPFCTKNPLNYSMPIDFATSQFAIIYSNLITLLYLCE